MASELNSSGIYRIQSKVKPEKIYIGSAVNFLNRWRLHKHKLSKNIHDSKKLQNHVNKYGIDDLSFEIVEQCNKEDLIRREQYYIDTLYPIFNSRQKAENNLGFKHSKKSIQKMKESWKKREFTPELKQKLYEGRKNMSEESKKLQSDRIKEAAKHRKPISEETREKFRQIGLKRTYSKETKKKFSDWHSNNSSVAKPVIQYDLNNTYVAEYKSMNYASIITGVHVTNIGRCCNNNKGIAGNYIWKFKN